MDYPSQNRPLSGVALAFFAAALSACASGPATEPQKDVRAPAAAETPDAGAPAPRQTPAGDGGRAILLCQMGISNPPPTGPGRQVARAGDRIRVNGVSLLLAPVTDGCLSSGFGPRNGRAHKGVDYFTRAGDAIAAGGGVIREKITRADFGNMILIDHGGGVYTRYAHLASFAPGLSEGAAIKPGARLGPVGATGAAGAVHLHYEILTGAYVSGVGSFGLKANDPFSLL